jgi:hypothetical protein
MARLTFSLDGHQYLVEDDLTGVSVCHYERWRGCYHPVKRFSIMWRTAVAEFTRQRGVPVQLELPLNLQEEHLQMKTNDELAAEYTACYARTDRPEICCRYTGNGWFTQTFRHWGGAHGVKLRRREVEEGLQRFADRFAREAADEARRIETIEEGAASA